MDEQGQSSQQRKIRYRRAMDQLRRGAYLDAAIAFADISEVSDLCGHLSRYYAGLGYLQLGLEQLRGGHYADAIHCLSLASEYNPRHEKLPHYLACCYAKQKRFDKAVQNSTREASLHSRSAQARVRLALCLWQDGQQTAAIATLQDAVREQPQQADWHFQLGVLRAAREQYAEAAESFRRTLQLDPDHVDGHVHLALCHGVHNDPPAAVAHLLSAQRLRPQDARIGLLLAMALKAAPHAEQAPQQLRLARPDPADPLNDKDCEELFSLVVVEPDIIEAFIDVPDGEMEREVFEILTGAVESAVERDPSNAELQHHLARLYQCLGRYEHAVECCERALAIDPQFVNALITQGNLYVSMGRIAEAARCFRTVLDSGRAYADIHFQLGQIYEQQGRINNARQAYEQALSINERYQAARSALESLAA